MNNQAEESITSESFVLINSIESLAKGYILNCRIEGKPPKTLVGYQMTLQNFMWYCKQNDFPEIQHLTAIHIKQFLWYLASEPHRWNSTCPTAKRQVNSTTVNVYFRALRTFFNWLDFENLINENPFKKLKTPKVKQKIIQALTPEEIVIAKD
jgi:site-specific recombinase XerD